MTTKTTVAPGSSFTVPAGISKARATARGAAGSVVAPRTSGAGRGALIQALLSVTSGQTFPVAAIPGGLGGAGSSPASAGGKGGDGINIAGMLFAGGGGAPGGVEASGQSTGEGGDAGLASGADGKAGINYGTAGGFLEPGHAAVGDTGGPGGTGWSVTGAPPFSAVSGGTSGTAGKSRANGGAGGAGGAAGSQAGGGGGGGGGNAGGGGGRGPQSGRAGVGAGGGGGSSSGGDLIGFNDSTVADALFETAAAPLQPTLTSPTGNAYIDRTIAQGLTFQANQASTDVLDAQTDAEVDYRLIGAGSWTTIGSLGTGTTATIAANTLAIGSYEWRARTKADGGVGDAMGVWGPYSETGYFRADNPATAPTVTAPTSGAVVAVNSATATWTVAAQTAFQMRVVGDNAGAPDPGTIYADSGEVISTDRTKTLTVGVNHVPAHVQVRVRDKTGGVWSAWVDVPVTIEWAGPPKPRVTLATDWRIHVTVTNPAPVGVEPVADRIEVYVIEGDTRERRAILAPGDGWIYETPPSGVEIGVEAVAIYTPTNVMTSSGVTY